MRFEIEAERESDGVRESMGRVFLGKICAAVQSQS